MRPKPPLSKKSPQPCRYQFDDGTHHRALCAQTRRPKTHRGRGEYAQHTNNIKGLQELVSVALTQGMTGQEIDQLIVQAVEHGTLIIPDTLRTPNGQPDTMATLATLVDATTPTALTLIRDVGNTYVVRPGDSVASIAVKY